MRRPSLYRSTLFFACLLTLVSRQSSAQVPEVSSAPVSSTPAPVTQARITQAIDEKSRVSLPGSVHPLARPEFDQGLVSDAQPLNRMLLLLQRSADQESALQKLLDEQQSKSSPNYHAWLTPEQFGKQFGPADADVQAVTDWLTSQGFTAIKVSPGRAVLEFSGTVGQVRNAFRTDIHRYLVRGEEHTANASDPQIPAALSPVVAGIVSLHNFPRKTYARYLGQFRRMNGTGETKPLFTFPRPNGNGNFYGLGPADFSKIYNTEQLWNAGIDGTGQTIAIVGETNINLQDVQDFRKIFGLPINDPQIILDGEDPGITSKGEEAEADLDVQWSGAVAKNATIKFVVSASTPASAGVDLSALYIIEHNLASVMSESYGECEQNLTATGNQFFNNLWQQAAAQGITVVVASGDGGSAGCDNFDVPQPATHGLAVSGFAGTPYNVSVGGTDFDQVNKWSLYWNPTSDPVTQLSAKSYIPEIPWNENCAQLGLSGCGPSAPNGSVNIVAASGGPSSIYSKPLWQLGVLGMPKDNHRDQPDVSLFASPGFTGTGYIFCQQDRNLSGTRACDLNTGSYYLDFHSIGGTSASAPAFAGIMALVNQKNGSRQGNANHVLYALAKKSDASCNASLPATITNTTCTFYDVTSGDSYFPKGVGTNSVPCSGGSLNCSSSSPNADGVLVDPKNASTEAWTAAAGYDMAAGLGSVNAYNLATNWASASALATKTTLTLSPTTGISHGQAENVSVTVGVAPASGSGQPTGDVSLIATLTDGTTLGLDSFTLVNGAISGQKTQNLPGGTYKVKAYYSGDGSYAPSESSQIVVAVNSEASQTFLVVPSFDPQTGLLVNPNASSLVYGSSYIIRTYVTNSSAVANPSGPPSPLCAQTNQMTCPSGTVALTDNGGPLDNGTYSLNDAGYTRDLHPFLTGGTHNLVAVYSGDNSYTKSTSATDTLTITPAPSQTFLNYVPTHVIVGQAFGVNFSTYMSATGGKTPTGSYKIYDGSTELSATVTMNAFGDAPGYNPSISGNANVTLATVGPHTISVAYSGDPNYSTSTSTTTQAIAQYLVTVNVSVDSSTVLYGTPVNVTATIVTSHTAPSLAGQVAFNASYNSITNTPSISLSTDTSGNQVLTAKVATTPLATEFISVNYSGDPNYADNYGNGTFVNVNIPDFTVNVPPNALLVAAGQSGSMQISVVPATTNSSPVMLSCSGGLPTGYTCSVQPTTVNLSGGATATATLSLTPAPSGATTVAKSSLNHTGLFPVLTNKFPSTPFWPIGPLSGIATFLGLMWRRRYRRLRLVSVFTTAFAIGLMLGCGGGGSSSGGGGGNLGPFPTSTTVSASAAKVDQQTPITFTAKVTGAGNPTGAVSFYVGGGVYGQSNLVAGTATFTTPIGFPGDYVVTATYNGDASNNPSTSPGLSEFVTGSIAMQVNGQTSTLYKTATVTVTVQ